MSIAKEDEPRLVVREGERSPSARRRRKSSSDHPARDAEMALEQTYRAFQRMMHETGSTARKVCDALN
jgi:hypothetical protein